MTFTPTVGLHPDISDHDYLFDTTSLSNSGAKKLLPPSCPAKFKVWRDSAQEEHKQDFDFGHVAHRLVLGKGSDVVVVPYDSWRTSAAKEMRDNAYAEGKAPILTEGYERATAMAEVIRGHETAAALFSNGTPEVAAFWDDPETGVRCRARFDWLPEQTEGRRLLIPDYKTAASAHPDKFAKSAADYRYHMQAAHYTEGARLLGLGYDPLMLFVVQEREPPFAVNVIPLDDQALKLGAALNDRARRIYKQCVETDVWPGYTPPEQIAEPLALPTYYRIQTEEFLAS